MRKIVILLGIILFMIACEKGNEEVREAKVVVVVYDENGKIATKLFNENEKPEKLIILIPWHQGWQLKLDGKDIVPDKYKSAMMEVMIPTGNHEFTMNFHPVYLKEGTIVSVISTVLFFGLLFVNHRKSRKRLLILPERGIIY